MGKIIDRVRERQAEELIQRVKREYREKHQYKIDAANQELLRMQRQARNQNADFNAGVRHGLFALLGTLAGLALAAVFKTF